MIAQSSVGVALIIGWMGIFFSGYIYRWIASQMPTDTFKARMFSVPRPHWSTLIRLVVFGSLMLVVGYTAQLGIGLVITFLLGSVTAWMLQTISLNTLFHPSHATIDQRFTFTLLVALGVNAFSLMAFSAVLLGCTMLGLNSPIVARLMIAYCFGMVINTEQVKSSPLNWVNLLMVALAGSMLLATQNNLALPYITFPLFISSTGLLLSLGILNPIWMRSYEQVSQLLPLLRLAMLGGYGLLMGLIGFGGILFFAGTALNTLIAMMSGVVAGFVLVFTIPTSSLAEQPSHEVALKGAHYFVTVILVLLGLLLVSTRLNGFYGLSVAGVGLLSILLILLLDVAETEGLSHLQYLALGLNALLLCVIFLQTSGLFSANEMFLSMQGLSRMMGGFVLGAGLLGWLVIECVKRANHQDQSFMVFDWVWTAFPSVLMLLTVLGMGNILGEIVRHETTFGFLIGFTSCGWLLLTLFHLPTLSRQMIFQSLQWIPLLAVMLSFWV